MSMGGGGGGGDGVTRYDWNPSIGSQWAADDGSGILSQARWLSEKPYERYGNGDPRSRIADMDPLQKDAIFSIGDFGRDYITSANNAQGFMGSKESGIARENIYNTLAGKHQNPYSDQKTQVGSNLDYAWQMQPGMGKATAGKNAYAGMDSPFYQSLINKGARDITDQYKQGTQAQTQKMMNLAGIFGGGAHQKAEDINQRNLGDTLANFNAQMGNTQYDRSAGLAEADIGRDLGAQQFNIGTGQQDYQAAANRALQARGQDVGNQMQADMYDKSMGNQNWEAERGRQMQATGQAFGADDAYYQAMQRMMGAGDANRQFNQGDLDFNYNQWKDQQDWGWNQLGRRANIVSQAQGGINPTAITSGGYTPGISPMAGLLGGAAFGNSMGWWGK